MKWLQVSLLLDGELTEATAELLARHAAGGVSIESTNLHDTNQAHPQPTESFMVRAFLAADSDLERRKRKLEEGLWHLAQILPLPDPHYEWLEEQDWSQLWKDRYKPFPVGRDLIILPAWLQETQSRRLAILLDPGMAFGTGTHPSTRMCLSALEDNLQRVDVVFDIGTGSGILSIAAARLGARRVLAFDTDADAVEAAVQNVLRNSVDDRVQVVHGSLEQARQMTASGLPNLVLANILAPTLTALLEEGLAALVDVGGRLILSGILEEQAPPLQEHAQNAGLKLIEIRCEQDWRALVLQKTVER